MMRKLRSEEDTYEATSLILAEWIDGEPDSVKVLTDLIPPDLQAGPFLEQLIDGALFPTPVSMHVAVREAREGRSIEVDE